VQRTLDLDHVAGLPGNEASAQHRSDDGAVERVDRRLSPSAGLTTACGAVDNKPECDDLVTTGQRARLGRCAESTHEDDVIAMTRGGGAW